MSHTKKIVTLISLFLGMLLVWQWAVIHRSYVPNSHQLETGEKAEQFLLERLAEGGAS